MAGIRRVGGAGEMETTPPTGGSLDLTPQEAPAGTREGTPEGGRSGAPRFQQTLLECLTEAALDGVIVVDALGRIVALNRRFVELWDLPRGAVERRDRPALTARILEQLTDPERFVARSDYLHEHADEVVVAELSLRDGRVFEHYSTPVRATDGTFFGRLGWYRDVTEQTQAAEALRASRDQLDAILGGVADGVIVQDAGGTFVYANVAAARIAGFPTAEAYLSASAAEIADHLSVLDAEGQPFSFDQLPSRRALRGEPAPEMLVQFRRRDTGEVRWSMTRARVIRGAGGTVLAISIFHDQTERMLAERRLRFLAEAGARLPASLDEAELLAGVTRLAVETIADMAAVYLLGEGETIRVTALDHRDRDRASVLVELLQRCPPLPGGRSVLWQTLRDGTARLAPDFPAAQLVGAASDAEHLRLLSDLGLASALFVPLVVRGHVLGAVGLYSAQPGRQFTAEDLALTEEVGRRAALALDNARLYTRAQDAVRARDEFLSVAAHELRTPVTTVKGLAQLLQRARRRGDLDDARLDRSLERIAESSDRLSALTNDLLDVSRLQTGRFELRLEPLDPVEFIRVLVERDAEQADERHPLIWRVAVPPGVACTVQADRVRLEQVLANLLDNAVRYTPSGGPVEVTVQLDGDGVRVAVRDRGIGLPPGSAKVIFEPFGRAPNASERQIRGMGLGLYLCRQIVERHDGRIWAESPGEGQGTTVAFWLPSYSQTAKVEGG